ncbi:response regulator [Rhizobium leguminosarum bv. viciae]|uniref:response regulator n=1 Tax=Rhizobium leguminosarum TaxID=384 RepID=UPI00103A717D|nr:response regulator [Rhizobium leguminosarum]MBY5485349.1 response regulator [Rhizobium leguminosarum]TBZ31106.1 response regulator [Rhizobium leguminosarum bv. viciae]TBZ52161.1 response regulator [Rhizobium leguminosarum bv. viciae]TBZ80543.1 response regulator [Rhizobium leguminosarum bv. viciae]TBZ99550.1 response regulator [Rhizobium leguminosarum bv. viciae]
MTSRKKHVSVVDDDESVREALPDLLRSFGLSVEAFASAEAFLNSTSLQTSDGMILDIAMPGMTGPELQQELGRRGRRISIIFITAIKDEDVRSRLIREGASDCLVKPFSADELQDALLLASLLD